MGCEFPFTLIRRPLPLGGQLLILPVKIPERLGDLDAVQNSVAVASVLEQAWQEA